MAGNTCNSFDALNFAVKDIAKMDETALNTLKTSTGISTVEDLSYLSYDDIKAALSTVPIVKLRILETVIA